MDELDVFILPFDSEKMNAALAKAEEKAETRQAKALLETLSKATSEVGQHLYIQVLFFIGKRLDDMLVDELHLTTLLPDELSHLSARFLQFGRNSMLGPKNMLATYWFNSLRINMEHNIFSMGVDGSSVGRCKNHGLGLRPSHEPLLSRCASGQPGGSNSMMTLLMHLY